MSRCHNGPVTQLETMDRRVSRTRRQLAEALVQLSLERGFDNLTVRDLTERADIGYATFFRPYPDKETLLRTILEDAIEDLVQTVTPLSSQPQQMLEALFATLGRQPNLYRVLLRTRHVNHLLERVFEIGTQVFLTQFRLTNDHALPADTPPALVARHVVGSIVNLIEWWLEQPQPPPEARMAAFVNALVMNPVHAVPVTADHA
jgi:AcrR family transcriptional regulator